MSAAAKPGLTSVPAVDVGMLIRQTPEEVFAAFTDPAVTTRFWFTKSSDRLHAGAHVTWEWEMYGVSTDVSVREVEENRRLLFDWGPAGAQTTVEMRFVPYKESGTYVHVAEHGFQGSGDEIVARVIDSTGGFTMVLSAAKALL